jgi:hypothetical protein
MPTIKDILAQATPRERTVMVCIRGDLAGEAARLAAEVARASEDWEPADLAEVHPGRELAAQLKAVREQVKAAEVPFLLRYIGDKAYSDLLAAHPSTKPDEELFDSVTFPRALIAASCVDPVMTEDEVVELFEVINEGQIKELFDGAWEVHNDATAIVPFSLAVSALLAGLGGEK